MIKRMSCARDHHLHVFFPFLLLILLLNAIFQVIRAQELEFDYDDSSPRGPRHWGDLRPEWSACKHGTEQSPVHVNHLELRPSVHALDVSYQENHAILQNKGHNMMVNWTGTGDAGSFVTKDETYVLRQSHWHSPSEHTFGHDTRYPLEMHTVYTSSTGKVAVISFVYNVGDKDDGFLSLLIEPLTRITETKAPEVDLGNVHPDEIGRGSIYFRYHGSLTTPPCTEGVIWILMEEVKTVSPQQLKALTDATNNRPNARPAQPINGREILMFKQI